MFIGSAYEAAKILIFSLFGVKVVLELKPIDIRQRIWYCNWMRSGLAHPQLLYVSNEA